MSKGRTRAIRPYQPNLFEPQIKTPVWQSIEPEVREAVTKLFAQMLKAHWKNEDDQLEKEKSNE